MYCTVLYFIVWYCIVLNGIALYGIALYCILESGYAFSVYLTDTHDGDNTDWEAVISAGSIIPYEQELINMHGGYNTHTGTNIYHIKG